jgi:hypothetical protein
MVHASEVEGIDGWFARPIAGAAIVAVNQRGAVGRDGWIGARRSFGGCWLLRVSRRHRHYDGT